MMQRLLICTDLDRTLLPNGPQPESPDARRVFARICHREEVELAYVSGRDHELVMRAILEFDLPPPAFVIGDVGTSIYTLDDGRWQAWHDWETLIGKSWQGFQRQQLADRLSDLSGLRLQEESKQGIYKLSFYTAADAASETLLEQVQARLAPLGVEASLIWSVDENDNTGLLDILPAAATKRHAIEFIMQVRGFTLDSTLFAGDSGNDLPVITSPIRSVLVANATPTVTEQAKRLARDHVSEETLYIARGGFHGMNGNYAAGILEGMVYYFPQTEAWVTEALGS